MLVTLTLTEQGAEMLKDVIDFWTQDFEEATNDVEHDRTLESADELLDNMSAMHNQFAVMSEIRNQLFEQLSGAPA